MWNSMSVINLEINASRALVGSKFKTLLEALPLYYHNAWKVTEKVNLLCKKKQELKVFQIIQSFEFEGKSVKTEISWSEFSTGGKATTEEILGSKERNKSWRVAAGKS